MRFNQSLAGALVALALVTPLAAAQSPRHAEAPQTAHQRVLPLEGGRNFRDLGGYATADGRTVKWGMLYRSGAMHGLTVKDYEYLARLGIRTVCDFRDVNERKREPLQWQGSATPSVFADDYALDQAMFMRTLIDPAVTGDKARAMLAGFYRELPFQFAGQYRRMFAQLLDGNAPLAFNCSAGKDRTGIAAALLLTALGVPREAVIEDYLLSNLYFKPDAAMAGDDQAAAFYRRLPPEVIKALMGVDRSYILTAFDAIEKRPGGIDAYFRDQLGLGTAEIAKLRSMYLQRG